jgi:hypothetical protein
MEDTGEIDIEEDLFTDLKEILAMFLVSEEMKRLVIESIDSPDCFNKLPQEILKNLPEQKNILEKGAVSYQTGHDNQGMKSFSDL